MKALIVVMLAGLAFAGPTEGRKTLRGKVVQTLDAGQYTYVLIASKEGERWAAVVKTALKKGAKVSVVEDTVMENFESKALGRKFDRVVFGSLETSGASNPHAGMTPKPEDSSAPVQPVAKAEGPEGRSIAEIFAQKAELKAKTVAVRGRVVKYNGGIMGVNWLHLRDGSGSAKNKDNDIAVTSEASAATGDVVTVRGTVTLDKDLGAGYFFPVLIEKAEILKN